MSESAAAASAAIASGLIESVHQRIKARVMSGGDRRGALPVSSAPPSAVAFAAVAGSLRLPREVDAFRIAIATATPPAEAGRINGGRGVCGPARCQRGGGGRL